MPNVLVMLNREIRRVEQLVPRLGEQRRLEAFRALEFAHRAMLANSYTEMRESLDELGEFHDSKPVANA